MSTQTAELTELEQLQRFIERTLARGGRKMPIKECLAEFREYQREVEKLRAELQPALERSRRGESTPLDRETLEKMKERVTRELADRGIVD